MTDPETHVRAAEDARCAALVARDRDALAALFADDLVHIHSTGQRMTKAQMLDYVTATLRFLSVARQELNVRLIGDAAVMTGGMTSTMVRDDAPERIVEARALVTQVWRRDGGAWQLISFQATRAAE